MTQTAVLARALTLPLAKGGRYLMKAVAEYRAFAQACRKLAATLTEPEDRTALEMMAAAWARIANDREQALQKGTLVSE